MLVISIFFSSKNVFKSLISGSFKVRIVWKKPKLVKNCNHKFQKDLEES